MLSWACAGSALAAPLTEDVPALKRAFVALLAGKYASKACSPIPGDGEPSRPGTVLIADDGSLRTGPVVLSMFDPQGEFALSKKYGTGGVSAAAQGFNYQFFAGGRMFDVTDDGNGGDAFVETGFSGDTRNVQSDGVSCASTDFRSARVVRAGTALHDFMTASFTTEGQTVTGMCRPARMPKGKKLADVLRPASFSMTTAGVTVNGRTLRFDDADNPVVEAGIGSRFSDGTLNGGFEWKDGSHVHFERFMGAGGRFGVFAFGYVANGNKEDFHCMVR